MWNKKLVDVYISVLYLPFKFPRSTAGLDPTQTNLSDRTWEMYHLKIAQLKFITQFTYALPEYLNIFLVSSQLP